LSAPDQPASVLARRLTEQPDISVLLIEAGPRDGNPMIHMPTGEIYTIGSAVDWQFQTEPEPQLAATGLSPEDLDS
jgi:choline dehydrogenase